jgi:hypothetical protein
MFQRIPVTSNPVGAEIIVDGKAIGFTPFTMSLKRGEDHTIWIKKEGYKSVVIRVESRSRPAPLGAIIISNLIWIPAGALAGGLVGLGFYSVFKDRSNPSHAEDQKLEFIVTGGVIGAIAVPVIASIFIGSSETKPVLAPSVLNVPLAKTETESSAGIIVINSEQLENIRWIRIVSSDTGAEELIHLNMGRPCPEKDKPY